jgi:hypothetical protein
MALIPDDPERKYALKQQRKLSTVGKFSTIEISSQISADQAKANALLTSQLDEAYEIS